MAPQSPGRNSDEWESLACYLQTWGNDYGDISTLRGSAPAVMCARLASARLFV